jgi:hypothetical protein
MTPSILLIDDNEAQLSNLAAGLKGEILSDEATILTWAPSGKDDPRKRFNEFIEGNDTTLVVTDYDLTGKARTGLFGSTIVGWCQAEAIPVGDYSRGRRNGLPTEPNLFELRVPTQAGEDSSYIAALFRGFSAIRRWFEDQPKLIDERSPAAILAEGLCEPSLESDFALYARLVSAGALVDKIKETAPESKRPDNARKQALLTYIIGHLLVNAVLRFPGPILTRRALLAYCGVAESEAENIVELFAQARYSGPFAGLDDYYWFSKVDKLLEGYSKGLEIEAETLGEVNRLSVEDKLKRKLERHACKRCNGKNGGFWCPFTERTVCQLPDCSVAVTSWIPEGARLCRVEREFYDEWAPVLGL